MSNDPLPGAPTNLAEAWQQLQDPRPNVQDLFPRYPLNAVEVNPQTLQDLLAWGNEEPVAGGITQETIGLSLDLLPQLQPEPILVFPPHTHLEP